MRKLAAGVTLFLIAPVFAFADCSVTGYTVVYVNGIFTSEQQARQDENQLKDILGPQYNGQDLTVRLGYNPSHLGGGGDLLESITQAFGAPVSDYDLKTILMQIAPEVTTHKILLLGHSQGTFYTNELYQYLIAHGVPKSSIAVYNVATPASYVAGGGGYVTSANDKVINAVRDAEVNGNVQIHLNSYGVLSGQVVSSALRANITVPKAPGWDTDSFGGHGFGSDYLRGAGDRIIADVQHELSGLKADAGDARGSCFEPPAATLAYKTQSVLFAVGDTVASGVTAVSAPMTQSVVSFANGAYSALASAAHTVFGSATGDLGQTADAAVPVSAPAQIVVQPVASSGDVVDAAPVQAAPAPVPQPTPKPQTVATASSVPAAAQPPAAPAVVAQDHPQSSQPLIPLGAPSGSMAFSVAPGFGGGGGGGGANTISSAPANDDASEPSGQQQEDTSAQTTEPQQDEPQTQPEPATSTVSLSVTSPHDGVAFATNDISLVGTADAGAIIIASFGDTIASTTASENGDWAIPLPLPEGDTRVSTYATNGAGGKSATDTRTITIDTQAPDAPSPHITACDASLVSFGCIVPARSVIVAWPTAVAASSYAVAINGIVGVHTAATSSEAQLRANATTTIAIIAYDKVGHAATSSELEVAALTQPLIINEIAWAGSGDTYREGIRNDEQWIELRNMSPYRIDLSHLSIERSGGEPIHLSGTTSADPLAHYLLVAPFSWEFVYGSDRNLVVPFTPLSTTSAEQLSLVWSDGEATTTLDSTPAPGACDGWCAGAYNTVVSSNVEGHADQMLPLSMERGADALDGTLASSWHTTDTYGVREYGTPGDDNTHGLPGAAVFCGTSDNILTSQTIAPGFDPGGPNSRCTYFSGFVTPNADRAGGFFEGDVGSSTVLVPLWMGHQTQYQHWLEHVPDGTSAGTHFFFAIWEIRPWPHNDNEDFTTYLETGTSSPPHGNYAVLPFVYQPR